MDPSHSFGRRWGGYLGSKAGEFIGGYAQSLSGLGDYSVSRNVFAGNRLPEIVNQPSGGGTIIRFQEYLCDVFTSSTANTFNIQSYYLNAANSTTFPFLSQIACNYEQYDFEGCLFEFRSTSANALNSTNTALGSVMMATQYDSYDSAFDSKIAMLNYEFSTACKPSENCMHMIECDPRQTTVNELYTLYDQGPPANADIRLYNLGLFSIATTGFQGTSVNIGQLHVTYQVRLLKPKLFTTLGLTSGYYLLANTLYSNAFPLGVAPITQSTTETIGIVQGPTTLTFDRSFSKSYYRIEIYWLGAVNAVLAYPTVTYTNCTSTSSGSIPSNGVNTNTACLLLGIVTDGNGLQPVVTLSAAGTLPATPTQVGVRIMEVSPTLAAT